MAKKFSNHIWLFIFTCASHPWQLKKIPKRMSLYFLLTTLHVNVKMEFHYGSETTSLLDTVNKQIKISMLEITGLSWICWSVRSKSLISYWPCSLLFSINCKTLLYKALCNRVIKYGNLEASFLLGVFHSSGRYNKYYTTLGESSHQFYHLWMNPASYNSDCPLVQ